MDITRGGLLMLSPWISGVCIAGEGSSVSEDAMLVAPALGITIVFDGHGEHGALVSTTAAQAIYRSLANSAYTDTRPEERLLAAFKEAQRSREDHERAWLSGPTAPVALVEEARLYGANVGDSSVFLNNVKGRRSIRSSCSLSASAFIRWRRSLLTSVSFTITSVWR